MSVAHGNPAPPKGEGGSGVERLRGLDDGEFLQTLVDNEVMNSLASAVRGERQRKFMAAVSTAINLFQIRVSDMLFSFGQCVATQSILHRHNATLEAADLIEVFCSRIEVLAGWGR